MTNSSREESDSALHILEAKKGGKRQLPTQLVVGTVEEVIAKGWLQEEVSAEILEEFLNSRGRRFYKLKEQTGSGKAQKVLLEKIGAKIPEV